METDMNKDYLLWDEAFIALSKLILLRSKIKENRTGSCIVDSSNRIMSLGYNGLPMGCSDLEFPTSNDESVYNNRSTYVVPSINNAILLARRNLEGCSLYTTSFPNSSSTKLIIQNGIVKLYYIENNFCMSDDYVSSLRMLQASGIEMIPMKDLSVTCGDKDLLTWDEAFVGLCKVVAMRSKDPSTQVGSCIVDSKKRIISLGYNGMPFGCKDVDFPWARKSLLYSDTKYPYVIHAEANALSIAQTTSPLDLTGATIYVSLFPCENCAMNLIQAGIGEIVYVSDKYAETQEVMASKRILLASGVTYRRIDDLEVTVEGYKKTLTR